MFYDEKLHAYHAVQTTPCVFSFVIVSICSESMCSLPEADSKVDSHIISSLFHILL